MANLRFLRVLRGGNKCLRYAVRSVLLEQPGDSLSVCHDYGDPTATRRIVSTLAFLSLSYSTYIPGMHNNI